MIEANDFIDLQRDQQIAASQEQAHEAQMEGRLLDLHTALVGIIVSFDPVSQTATIQPSQQRLFLQSTSSGPAGFQPLSLLVDVPVYFPAGGAGVLTFPVAKGDECLVVFSERSIDEWFQNGGTNPPQYRLHSLSDAIAFVGISSRPRRLSNVSATATELRTRDGLVKVSISETGVAVTGNLTVTGNVVVQGTIEAEDVSAANGVDLVSHVHEYGGGVPPPSTLPPTVP